MLHRSSALTLILIFMSPIHGFTESTQVQVAEIQFRISKNKTRQQALQKRLMVKPDAVYTSFADLQAAVDKDVQELKNLRIFEDVRADLLFVPGSGNRYKIIYEIEEGITFIPVPLLLYNSNYGGFQLLYVQIWGNMFGTLADSFSIFSLTLRDDGTGKTETGPWLFAPIISNIRVGSWDMRIGMRQEHIESSRYNGAELVSKYMYNQSSLSTKFIKRFGLDRQFYYTVGPGITANYDYRDIAGLGGFPQIPFEGEVFQSLYYDTVDFYYNARRGWLTGATSILRLVNTDSRWKPEVDFELELGRYMAWGRNGWFSYYPRLMALKVFNGVSEKLGRPVRGIPDDSMDGNLAIYMNQTIGISVWRWNKVWDLQFHPWFDMAIAAGGTRSFRGWQDVRKSVGADIIWFFDKVPNFSLRFSWGVDLDPDLVWGDDNKTEFVVQYAHSY